MIVKARRLSLSLLTDFINYDPTPSEPAKQQLWKQLGMMAKKMIINLKISSELTSYLPANKHR